ncbi:Long-chain fatty acid transport protein 4 [Cryptotermes secundus]|uniref:long-chain-fatty-acid--CoA ligase n=1 Tax=Cryptotermes secundus TaxID=105785 RepID=A0A2J7Q856_9NEOP|nr:long-chain fatty acid transport protein 4 [Cryptotermes secundus]PNF24770.1 Long-chain fatty acid transport protein 4 [Cryptotermes secundus]
MVTNYPALVTSILAVGAAVSFVIGRRVVPQLVLLAVVGFLTTGKRYKWLYILYKTIPRDSMALCRFMQLNMLLWWWERHNMTIPKVFCDVAQKHPKKVAFHCNKQQWTFAKVEEFSNRVAHYCKSVGLNRGDTVALFMESKPEYVCIWLGLSKIGVITALINSNLRQLPLVHTIKIANSRAIIFGSELASELQMALGDLSDLPLYQYNASGIDKVLLPGAVDLLTALASSPSDLPHKDLTEGSHYDKVLYIFTSGTTGLPKAAVISHSRYMFMSMGVHYMLRIQADDTLYTPLPLYHTAGGTLGVGQVLLCGASLAIRSKFSASNFWADCIAYNCTVAQYIGEMCRYLLSLPVRPEERQHKVRLMFGNGLRPQIWEKFVTRFGIKQIGEIYGATEGNSNLVNIDSTVGAVGFMPRYARIVYRVGLIRVDETTGEPIRGKDGLCILCEPGEPGVFVGKIDAKKSFSSFTGYADQKESEKKVIYDVFKHGDQGFNSGDILVMDELGYFYFRDRTGDTFRWRGENVSTAEVEAVISNIAGLKDAVVYGVEVPHVEGRAGMAAIVDTDGTFNLVTFVKGIQENLPTYARPLFIRILSRLQITGTFKIKKVDLRTEGFDPHKIKDKLYFLSGGQYIPLTEKLYEDITSGRVRL